MEAVELVDVVPNRPTLPPPLLLVALLVLLLLFFHIKSGKHIGKMILTQ